MNKIDYAKQTLKSFVPTIDDHLEKVWKSEIEQIDFPYDDIKDLAVLSLTHSREHNLRDAKRLRATFVNYAYKMLGGQNDEKILDACASVELVHTALLMQDDFADRDPIRRGKITTHKYFQNYHEDNLSEGDADHYGNSMAVFVGDVVLTLGYRLMNEVDFDLLLTNKAVSYLLNAIIETGYGQIYDITLEARKTASEDDIVNLHHAKTSIYTYRNPLHVGAILAGAKDSDLELLTKYAVPGGIAFQLQDDVLGLFGDSDKTGKSDFADIREGKKTLLIINALEKATGPQKKKLLSIWGNHDMTEEDADKVREIVVDTGSLKHSKDIAENYARESQKFIPEMKKRGWEESAVDFLDGVSEYMAVGREK